MTAFVSTPFHLACPDTTSKHWPRGSQVAQCGAGPEVVGLGSRGTQKGPGDWESWAFQPPPEWAHAPSASADGGRGGQMALRLAAVLRPAHRAVGHGQSLPLSLRSLIYNWDCHLCRLLSCPSAIVHKTLGPVVPT